MRKLVMLAAVTRINRHQATADINDAVAACGGWILQHTLFSNIATTFLFELPPARFSDLAAHLAAQHVVLDAESLARMTESGTDAAEGGRERTASLNVTFIHDEPDLRREIPAVPG